GTAPQPGAVDARPHREEAGDLLPGVESLPSLPRGSDRALRRRTPRRRLRALQSAHSSRASNAAAPYRRCAQLTPASGVERRLRSLMARIDNPEGEGGDAAQVWLLRPDMAPAVGKMVAAAYRRSRLRVRERA